MANWRNRDEVLVGWLNSPELGMLSCVVVQRDRTNDEPHGVRVVKPMGGKSARVAYCHSQSRYVFVGRGRQ